MTATFMLPHNDEYTLLHSSLLELRQKSLLRIAILISAVCYLALLWAWWPLGEINVVRQMVAVLCIFLMLVALAAVFIGRRWINTAALLLVVGLVGAVYLFVFSQRAVESSYLLFIPLIFTSVLLGQRALIGVAVVTGALILTLGALGLPTANLVVILGLLIAFTIAIWIATSNLYTALKWALNGYEAAFKNQEIARDRKATLEGALKSLEIATTNLQRANHSLNIARREALEARQAKQQFAEAVSHELRTPLNLIIGFTETMIQSPEYYGAALPPRYLRDLTIVHRNAVHLQSLVNDVLDLARIETAQMSLHLEQVALSALAEDVVNIGRSLVEARGLTFISQIPPQLPTCWLDPIRIRQILINLLSNAVRYTDAGSITFGIDCDANAVIFRVVDTGIGIPADQLERIFEPFYQANAAKQRRSGGVGLGLTISRQLALMHGGSISVESQVGVGSTFWVRLPLDEAALFAQTSEALAERHEPIRKIDAAYPPQVDENIVLLVTRSLSAAAMVARHLRSLKTVVAQQLALADQVVRQVIPQAVIIDSADETVSLDELRALAERWGLSSARLIACSLPGEEVLRQRLAADGYLIKPVSGEQLQYTLHQFGEMTGRILLVDDDRDFVRLLERMLSHPLMQYRVMTAHTGADALALIDVYHPDVILLDIEMPDLTGIEVLERIRARSDWAHIRVIIVSAQDKLDETATGMGGIVAAYPARTSAGETLRWIKTLLEGSGA